MNRIKEGELYDFHTHISNIDELESYFDLNIIPVINIRNIPEFNIIEKYKKNCENKYLSKKYYLSAGVHPFDNNRWGISTEKFYSELIQEISFIGEIGMDGYWSDVDIDIQTENFIKSLELAKKNNLPVILHTKHMEGEIYDIIKKHDLKYIVHWYSCKEYIDKYVNLGCYFTFGPAIMVDENIRNLAKSVPLDKILIETDGLDALKWLYNKKINIHEIRQYLELTINELARIKNISIDELVSKINDNSEYLLRKGDNNG